MNSDDFEKRLERQTIRPIPGEWRRDILQHSKLVAAEVARLKYPSHSRNDAQEIRVSSPRLLLLKRALCELLWPCPQAWAGLAAIWVLVFAMNFNVEESKPKFAKTQLSSREMILAMKEQRRLYLELVRPSTSEEAAEPPKKTSPRPQSKRQTRFEIV